MVESLDREFDGLTFSNAFGAGEIVIVKLVFLECQPRSDSVVNDLFERTDEIRTIMTRSFRQFTGRDHSIDISRCGDNGLSVALSVHGPVWRKLSPGVLLVGPGIEILAPLLEGTGRMQSFVQRIVDDAVGSDRVQVTATLERGRALYSKDGNEFEDSVALISKQIVQHERELKNLRGMVLGAGCASAALVIVGAVTQVASSGSLNYLIAYLLAGAALICASVAAVKETDRRREVGALKAREEISRIDGSEQEKRAQRLFQAHSGQIDQYYRQALNQRKSIFSVGIICIALGFGIISLALFYLQRSPLIEEKVLIAVLGAVGSILANFIGIVYLRMFTETVRSTGDFHNRLVLTHHLHFANLLAAQIRDPVRLDQSLADLVRLAARQGAAINGSHYLEDKGDSKP